MFSGHALRTQDEKGRLMLPSEFRNELGRVAGDGPLVLTNFDDCIQAYPLPEWKAIEESFARLNMADPNVRNLHRFFISSAESIVADKQGRILIPNHLRVYAGLKKDIVLAGVGRKFEIWDMERFEERRKSMEQDMDKVMGALAAQGFELRF